MKRTLYLFAAFILVSIVSGCKNQGAKLPNVVLIFIDDMGYADVSCFGARDYGTPNIDRLAGEGIRFTSFYASQAVCSASRASLLTGCYADRVGIQGALNSHSSIGINPEEEIIPEMLKEKSYATGIFGKWHLGHHPEFLPLQNGFDEFVGLPYSNDMWPVDYDGTSLEGIGKRKSNYPPLVLLEGNDIIDTIATLEDQARLTGIYTKKAVEFIHKHKQEPFFLYLPHSMVHVPIAASKEFAGKSGKGLFADVMLEIDWSVGEILRTLEENDLDENTLVIFTSDNGPWLNFGNHAGSALPLREGKGAMWEGGPRVSAMMRWPSRIPQGLVSGQIASTIDILPTLAEITDASLPKQKIDGVSLLALMTGEKGAKPRDHFFYYYERDLIAVRKDNYKLVFPHAYRSYLGLEPGKNGYPGPTKMSKVEAAELYDLDQDISETTNLAAQYPVIVRDLERLGDEARKELGDRLHNIKGEGVRKPGRIYPEKRFVHNLAKGKKITIENEYSFQYSGSGDSTLIDGNLGSLDFTDEQWLGFQGTDVLAFLDLGEVTNVRKLECGFLVNQGSWIFAPESVRFFVSADGSDYQEILNESAEANTPDSVQGTRRIGAEFDLIPCRYIKMQAKTIGNCPDWHPGAGNKAWLFLDEIIVL